MPTISAILPSLNEEENIERLVTQLQSQAGEDLIEIIVVD
jgi:glycosyltransferase involved in cell wall biosynthesis